MLRTGSQSRQTVAQLRRWGLQLKQKLQLLHAEAAEQMGWGTRPVEETDGQPMLDYWAELRAALPACWQPMLQIPPGYDSKQQGSEAELWRLQGHAHANSPKGI